MTVIQAIGLGIVQGLTEFVPVSSSAHLVIVPWLFRWNDPGLAFDVAVHLGTLAALLWFFWTDLTRLVRAGIDSIVEKKIGDNLDRRLACFLTIGTVPGVIVGVLAETKVEELFHQPNSPHAPSAMTAMAIVIALLGVALLLAEGIAGHRRGLTEVSLKDSVIIGFAQALAIFPGVSRSGSTITAGLVLGFQREAAARFSFLLSVPIVAGAGVKTLLELIAELKAGAIAQSELVLFAIGFLTAAVTGYLCIRLLLRFLQQHSTRVFVYYRWLLAGFVVAVAFARG